MGNCSAKYSRGRKAIHFQGELSKEVAQIAEITGLLCRLLPAEADKKRPLRKKAAKTHNHTEIFEMIRKISEAFLRSNATLTCTGFCAIFMKISRRWFSTFLSLFLLQAAFLNLNAFAEDSLADIEKKISGDWDKVKDRVKERSRSLSNPGLPSQTITGTPVKPTPGNTFKKHYRGEGGTKIEMSPELEARQAQRVRDLASQLEAQMAPEMEKLKKDLEKSEAVAMEKPVIWDCRDSKRSVHKSSGKGDKVEFDMLILRKAEVPSDTKSIFGSETVVIGFDESTPNATWIPLHDFKVECLPYRLRVLGNRTETYYGRDALKNFDKVKKGQFHEYIKSKYGQDNEK